MKAKKTIAGICALAMLGTCGMTAFAEEVTTTTTETPAETTVTTAETTEASATMTEGTTDTSVTTEVTTEETTETAVTEENAISKDDATSVTKEELYNIFVNYVSDKIKAVGLDKKAEDIITFFDFDKSIGVAYGTYTDHGTDGYVRGGYCKITKDGVTELTTQDTKDAYIEESIRFDYAGNKFVAMLTEPEMQGNGDNDFLISIYNITSGEAVATNLYHIKTGEVVFDGNTHVKPKSLSSYLSVGDFVTLMGVSYTYDKTSNIFVEGTTPITTTTTTTISSVTKEELYNIFVNYVSSKIKANGLDDFYKAEDIITFFDFDKSTGVAYGTYAVHGTTVAFRGGYCKITKDGVTELTTQYNKDAYIKETIRFDYAGNKFVAMLTKPEYASQGDNDYLISIYNITSGEAVATNLYRVKTGAVVVGGNNVKPLSSYLSVGDCVNLMGVSYTYDKASNKFVKKSSIGEPEKTFDVSIPKSYITEIICSIDGDVTNEKGLKDSLYIFSITSCSNGQVVNDYISVGEDFKVRNVKPGEIIITGTCGTPSDDSVENTNHSYAGHECSNTFTLKAIVNEDGTISPYTSGGSNGSSTASKKNPAGTGNSPKTGDNTVLPVALTLTFVAGTAVVASVKRFKK
ncbi:MAG: hypothetical protein IJZ64_03940 [Ruminococcus sp.]|nr:hypothetical protein [Ruminococcus sp.]